MEQPDGIGAAADAGHQRIRKPTLALGHLLARSPGPMTDWKSRTMAG